MLLDFGNPDHDVVVGPQFDIVADLQASGGSIGIRPDGYAGRPGFTSTGGHSYAAKYPRNPGIHPVFNRFRNGYRILFEQAPADPLALLFALNANNEVQAAAVVNPDMSLAIYSGLPGSGGVSIRESNTVLDLDTFYRIGFACEVSPSSNEGYIQLNRTVVCRAPIGANLEPQSYPGWAGFGWGIPEDSAVCHYYGGDSYGHQPDLLPDLLVKYSRPAATTDVNDWVGNVSPAPDAINDASPDDDSGWMGSPEENAAFLQALGSFDATERIYAGKYTARVRNVNDYGPAFRHLLALDAVIREGDIDYPLELYYRNFSQIIYQAPGDPTGISYPQALAMAIGGRQIGS